MSMPAAYRSSISARTTSANAYATSRSDAVVVVLGLLGHRERPGDRDLGQPVGVRAQELGVADQDRPRARRSSPDDPRHRERVAVAVQRLARVVDVDPVERHHDAVGVALAPLLAVGDDVQAGRSWSRIAISVAASWASSRKALLDAPEVGGANPRGLAPPQLLAIEQPLRLRVGPHEARKHRAGTFSYRRCVGAQREGERLGVGARAQRLGGAMSA